MRKYPDPELDMEMDFKIKISPADNYGNDIPESEDFSHVREHKIKIICEKGKKLCDLAYFALYPQIKHEIYKVSLEMEVTDSIKSVFEGIYFTLFIVNEKYTSFLISLRYAFLGISAVLGTIYLVFFFRASKNVITFEHKAIAVLSIFLVFFNDPFYYLTIYNAGTFWAVVSNLEIFTFISFLLIFWIVMVQRIHKEKIRKGTKLLNKYTWLIWSIGIILFLITGIMASIVTRFDPGFHSRTEMPLVYQLFMIILMIYCIILVVGLLFNIYKIFKDWNQLLRRHKVFFTISFYFFFAFFLISLTGFYQSYDSNGVKVLLVIFLGNFYVFLLQFLWRFAPEGNKEFEDIIKKRALTKQSSSEV